MILPAIPFPKIDPVAFALGPVKIRWYGLAYLCGLMLGWLYIRRLLSAPRLWADEKPPMTPAMADDLFSWVAAGVIVGGRLGHVVFYEPSYYIANPLQIFAVWNGGMSFHGGLMGTGLAMFWFARRHGYPALSVMDLVAGAVPFGLFFGRIANFVNGEVVGAPTSMPWGMVFPNWGPDPRHPAMLYEAATEGILLFLLLRYLTHARAALRQPGTVTGWFLIGYGGFRIFCELFKFVDYRLFTPALPITKGMAYSMPMIALGIAFLVFVRQRSANVTA